VPRLFELPTVLLKYLRRSFTGELQSPCPPGCYTYMIVITKMIETYNIAAQPYYCLWTHAYCIELRVSLTYLSSEKKTLRYQLCSTCYAAVRISNCLKELCNQCCHYENYGRFNGSHQMPTTESTLFVVNKDEHIKTFVKYTVQIIFKHLYRIFNKICCCLQFWAYQNICKILCILHFYGFMISCVKHTILNTAP